MISQERQQTIGVTYGRAETRDLARVIRASARVAYDPELYAAIEEYRQTVDASSAFKTGASPRTEEFGRSVAEAAKTKLRLMGLGEGQISELARLPAEKTRNLLLAQPGGSVWVYAEVYEREAGLIKPGQAMELRSPALSGASWTGKVAAVDPLFNPATRSARVRAEVANADGRLRPEMSLQALLRVPLGRRLSVPKDAVLDSGERKLVFVAREGGLLEPREVVTGLEAEDHVAIVSGVSEGERIVTSANFLIDSESQLKAAVEAFKSRGAKGRAH